jgi:Fe-S oxidoreductase
LGALLPSLFNFFVQNGIISGPVKKALGFAQKRQIPSLSKITLHKWIKKHPDRLISQSNDTSRTVNLFIDEFTNYNESDIGIKAIGLLVRLGYNVNCPETGISGRTFISKGLLRTARKTARKNIEALQGVVSGQNPLLGIEPSAVLSFRDEYPDLAGEDLKHTALDLANHVFLVEEFLVQELEKGKISQDLFTSESKQILYHGHCQQKAIASTSPTIQMLSLPENYVVEEIPSGCCGMAGSFGYEKEHYDLSMKVGELVLFPEIRKHRNGVILSASGTSCRQQIMDGTGRQALHPIEILHDALV